MSNAINDRYIAVLHEELVPALGCTEPIALAYASALARQELGALPDRITAVCSGNIVKNVKGVTVPNSGGQKGIKAAVILGAVGGNAGRKLEVLTDISDEDIRKTRELEAAGFCTVELAEGEENLYIRIEAERGADRVTVEIAGSHTNVTRIERNGQSVFSQGRSAAAGADPEAAAGADPEAGPGGPAGAKPVGNHAFMEFAGILRFAEEVDLRALSPLLEMQIEYNSRIAEEGIRNPYGVNTGKKLLDIYGDDLAIRARAKAAAGSDARMGGSDLAVVINSGSGNQGLTVSLPVIEYAQDLGCDIKALYRALIISNLTSIYIKEKIGSLSAFCGAVSAGAGSSAGITYLLGGTEQQIQKAVSNTIAIASGVVCDGAKPSCAAKVSLSVDAAIMASKMAMSNENYAGGDGIVMDDIEATINNVARLGRDGMKETDLEILSMMLC